MKRAVIHADGASLGNPGAAGIGVVVVIDGHVTEIARHIGTATNNIAEYSALVAGLEEALQQGAEEADVRLDSELAVKQMLGQYKVKNEGLKPLFGKAKKLSRKFRKFSIRHVPREENSHADRLSKQGAKGNPASKRGGTLGMPSSASKEKHSTLSSKESSLENARKEKTFQNGSQGELF